MNTTYLFLLFFFLSCGGTSVLQEKMNELSSTGSVQPQEKSENEFSVVKYDIDDIDFSIMDKEEVVEEEIKTETTVAKRVIGYRIQIATISDFNRMREFLSKLKSQFSPTSHEVYKEYNSPNYKLRIGDFLTKEDALKVLPMVKRMGYKDAWPVRAKIFVYE